MVNEDAMDLNGTKVTVVGLARSGVAVARLLQAVGAHVTVADRKERSELGPVLAQRRQCPRRSRNASLAIGRGKARALQRIGPAGVNVKDRDRRHAPFLRG